MKLRVLAALGMLLLAGCKPASQRADLIFVNGAEPETLDPAIITGQPEGRLVNALFEGLTTFNAQGKSGPGVAESWTISDDKKTYVFKLRPDAKWSDGTPVTAQDFVKSWKRALTPETGASYNYQLFFVKNAEAYFRNRVVDLSDMEAAIHTPQDYQRLWKRMFAPWPGFESEYQLRRKKGPESFPAIQHFYQVGVQPIDNKTLKVELENSTPFFLDLCATPPLQPVPVAVAEKYGDDWVKPEHIVTNGAYLLQSWRINDKIELKKNPDYWNAKAVALDRIDVLPISKANVAFNFYAGGLADLLMDKGLAPPALLDELRKRDDFHAAPFLGIYFLRFNCSKPPFNDARVRAAFSLCVDKNIITKKITRAGELPATSLVPPGIAGYTSPDTAAFDPEKARQLLAEAGFPGGKGFPLTTYLYSEGELNEAIAIELQNMWREHLGVTINLARQEWKVYLNSLSSLDFGIARSTWVGDYPDPNTFLDMFLTGGGNNRTGWSDPAYDKLIADAAGETDAAKRFEILKQAENLLLNTQNVICPIYYYMGIQLYDPAKIGGIEANVLDEHPLRLIYRKK